MLKLLLFMVFTVMLSFQFSVYSQGLKDCNNIKESVFYSYPKNSSDSFKITFTATKLIETNLKNGNKSEWSIKWKNDCSYELVFISTTDKLKPDVLLDVYRKFKFLYKVKSISAEYFIFELTLNKGSNIVYDTDTMFVTPKKDYLGSEIYKEVANEMELKKAHFKDTSKYAVVYLYRKGKTLCFGADGIISINDIPMWLAKNKSSAIFKIIKEGSFKLTSLVNGKVVEKEFVAVFGKRYYIECSSVWSHKCQLEIIISDEKIGKDDFNSIF